MFKRHHETCTPSTRGIGMVDTYPTIHGEPRTCGVCYGRIPANVQHSESFMVED